MNISGVYTITHTDSGKQYVGSTATYAKRVYMHKWHLRRGSHHSRKMQSAWDKYGSAAFEFRLQLVCAVEDLLFYEQRLISAYQPAYNILPNAGSVLGVRWTQEQRAKHRLAMAARVRASSPEQEAARVAAVKSAWEQGRYDEAMRAKSNHYTHEGRTYTHTEAAKAFGVNANTIKYRIAKGMTFIEAVTLPLVRGGRFAKWDYKGEKMTLQEVADLCGVKRATILQRMHFGRTFEEAIQINLG